MIALQHTINKTEDKLKVVSFPKRRLYIVFFVRASGVYAIEELSNLPVLQAFLSG